MYILLGSLRTGFLPDSRVFQYREPSAVLGILISNILASMVLAPEQIKELVILKQGVMDESFSGKIEDYSEIHQSRIVIQENQSFIDWLDYLPPNTPFIISSLNRTEEHDLKRIKETVKVDVATLPEEKVAIEISNSVEQKLLWYEDMQVRTNLNIQAEMNGAATLVFAKEIDFEVHDVPMYEMNVLHQAAMDDPAAGEKFRKLLLHIKYKFNWPVEFDYLNEDQFTLLKAYLFEDKYKAYAHSSNLFGNAYVLNGFRAINALYHKMIRSQSKNGLVFIEQNGMWSILHFKKVEGKL